MKNWSPVDWVVLILTIAISGTFMVTGIIPLLLQEPISDARSKILGGIATSIVSVVSVYVGAKLQQHIDKRDEK